MNISLVQRKILGHALAHERAQLAGAGGTFLLELDANGRERLLGVFAAPIQRRSFDALVRLELLSVSSASRYQYRLTQPGRELAASWLELQASADRSAAR